MLFLLLWRSSLTNIVTRLIAYAETNDFFCCSESRCAVRRKAWLLCSDTVLTTYSARNEIASNGFSDLKNALCPCRSLKISNSLRFFREQVNTAQCEMKR